VDLDSCKFSESPVRLKEDPLEGRRKALSSSWSPRLSVDENDFLTKDKMAGGMLLCFGIVYWVVNGL